MRLTIRYLQRLRDEGTRITVVTAYDAPTARLVEETMIPVILVGDSLGMVIQGHDTAVPVRLEHMIYHTEIVSRVTKRPLIVADLPFLTYATETMALVSAARLMQEGLASAVKLEGGAVIAPIIRRVVETGIPVMGHIGLTPQSVHQVGGWRAQGRTLEQARQLVRDADALQQAGVFALVLELMPAELAGYITRRLAIPTIGIGAGKQTSGQVQVLHDLVGLPADQEPPRHAKQFAAAGVAMRVAVGQYHAQVLAHNFPTAENTHEIDTEILAALREEFGEAPAPR